MTHSDRPALYEQDGQRRWHELVREMVGSGEVAAEQLDLSTSSLRTVWQWVLPRLRLRPDDEPVDEAVQPPWWSGPSWRRYPAWDDVTHQRVSAVAHHLRQVLLAQPGASADLGESGTVDAGEPVIRFADRLDINPLREVKMGLADVWDGRPDPDALAKVVEGPPFRLSPELLWPTRLVLRMTGPARGVLRRRRDLDTSAVTDGLRELVQQPVEPPTGGNVQTEHLGAGDWRALITITGDRQRLREVEVVIGAGWGRDEPILPERGPAVREFLRGLLALAERTDAEVDVVKAVPDDQHAPRPTGRLTASNVEHVLRALDL